MRRRDFIKVLGCAAAVGTWPVGAESAGETRLGRVLQNMKRDYEKLARPTEVQRTDYVSRLVRLREHAVRLQTDTWKAIDAEIKQHPAPADSDAKVLASRLIGAWASPRHDYLYRADGTWTMLPAEVGATHGTWRIEGNQYFDSVATDPPGKSQYTIILISKRDFVFADQSDIFYETRLK